MTQYHDHTHGVICGVPLSAISTAPLVTPRCTTRVPNEPLLTPGLSAHVERILANLCDTQRVALTLSYTNHMVDSVVQHYGTSLYTSACSITDQPFDWLFHDSSSLSPPAPPQAADANSGDTVAAATTRTRRAVLDLHAILFPWSLPARKLTTASSSSSIPATATTALPHDTDLTPDYSTVPVSGVVTSAAAAAAAVPHEQPSTASASTTVPPLSSGSNVSAGCSCSITARQQRLADSAVRSEPMIHIWMLPLVMAYHPTWVYYCAQRIVHARYAAEAGAISEALDTARGAAASPQPPVLPFEAPGQCNGPEAFRMLNNTCVQLIDSLALNGWLSTEYTRMAKRLLHMCTELAITSYFESVNQLYQRYRVNTQVRFQAPLSIFALLQQQQQHHQSSASAAAAAATAVGSEEVGEASVPPAPPSSKRRRGSIVSVATATTAARSQLASEPPNDKDEQAMQ
jgi:hypothetical protein